jgi:hypothetical protein
VESFLTDERREIKLFIMLKSFGGRVLARDVYLINKSQIAHRNVEISMDLAGNLAFNHPKEFFVRSSTYLSNHNYVLCYSLEFEKLKVI